MATGKPAQFIRRRGALDSNIIKAAMKLENVYYFSQHKQHYPPVFRLAQKVLIASEKNLSDSVEIQRRLTLLTRCSGKEHLRQCANFLAEAIAFDDLTALGKQPHWVPEDDAPTPDLQYESDGKKVPVEVKHLNNPREEHEALASGKAFGGSVNTHYEAGIQKKIEDFITSARMKFAAYHRKEAGTEASWAVDQKHPIIVCRLDNTDVGVLHPALRRSFFARRISYVDFSRDEGKGQTRLRRLLQKPRYAPVLTWPDLSASNLT